MPESPSVARELAAHSQALRSLARDLVGSADADDLVQETAVRALRSPPPSPTGLFAWFATVMRNVAANRARGERRRRRRENANAAALEVPCASSDVVHRDGVRAMTDALWRLPEPYQSTLVQRYFQGLSPGAIAARAATPVATVKSRLQRGLELLRAALAARDGRDWRAALVPAFGLPAGSSPWSLLSVSSMSTFAKVSVVLAAGATAMFCWWAFVPTAAPLLPQPVANANANAGESPTALAGAPEPPAEATREAASADVPTGAAALAQPFAFELRCRVVDADGVPVSGAEIALAPPACALASWLVPTDDDGRVTIAWRGRAATLVMALGLVHDGAHTSLQRVNVAAGEPADVHFVTGLAPLPASVEVDAVGRQIVTMPECSQGRADCSSCHQGMKGPDVFTLRGELRPGLHPDAMFGDRLVGALPQGPDLVLIDDLGEITWESKTARILTGNAELRIAGRVFGADGKPVGGARVALRPADTLGSSQRTKADGTFVLPWPAKSGSYELRAGGGPEGAVTRAIEAVDRSLELELLLATGRTLRGRACDATGKVMNGARVEYVGGPGHDGDVATVGPDGKFAFANLPPGPGKLLLWGVKGEMLPVAVEASVLPDSGDVEFDLRTRPATGGSLRLFVRGHDGGDARDCEVRVWQRDTQRGACLERKKDGACHAHGLMAGFYRVEVGTIASGWRDLGEHWVDGAGVADLGTVQLPAPALLRIDTAADLAGLELWQRRADLDVRADVVAASCRELLLPAGRWLALWMHDGKTVVEEIVLALGAPAVLRPAR